MVFIKPRANRLIRDRLGGILTKRVPTAWTPQEVTTELWLDPSETATIVSDVDGVITLPDKSGNGYDAGQSFTTARPDTGTRTLNGLNMLDFNGTTDYLSMATGPANDSDTIALAVVDFDGASSRQRIISFQDGVATRWSMRFSDATTYEYNQDDASFGGVTKTFTPSIGPRLFSGYRDGNNVYAGINGVYNGVEVSTDGTFTEWRIGAYRGTGQTDPSIKYFLDGGVGEILIIKEYTLALLQKAEGYLAWKWGLVSDLPAAHPYKSTPPTV